MDYYTWMSRKSLSTAGDGKTGKNKISTYSNMNKADLTKLSKEELIEMLLEKQKPKQKTKKPNKLENIIREMRKSEIPSVIKSNILDKKYRELVNPETIKPKIRKLDKALNEYKKSYEIQIIDKRNPLIQMNRTRNSIFERMLKTLQLMKGFKLLETVKVTFEKTVNKTTANIFQHISTAQTILY